MNESRRAAALEVRIAAAELAASRPHPRHIANGDEQKFRRIDANAKSVPSYLASFTKGMPHNEDSGLILDPRDFDRFVRGIDSGNPRDFKDTRLGPADYDSETNNGTHHYGNWKSAKAQNDGEGVGLRAWESQAAGNTFDLEGPDAQAVTMPPAPVIGSDELIGEMGEVYAQALLRDVPFSEFSRNGTHDDTSVDDILCELNALCWFKPSDPLSLSAAEASRKRKDLTRQTAFRGITPGDDVGPYVSQFMLSGSSGINRNDEERKPETGQLTYGALSIEQKVRLACPTQYMTTWYEWLDVQNAADVSGKESYEKSPKRRFITTPRDMTTYVHYDALYEAYLNACLLLLDLKIPFDPGIPYQDKDAHDHQQGFAHFGGPHILSLVTEVATRALKAVRVQKFNVHRRLRPEVLAARMAKHQHPDVRSPELKQMVEALRPILDRIDTANPQDSNLPDGNYLLPMAFCEGSPMHPCYGAGHATVAGACVTLLKAFFDHKHPLGVTGKMIKDGEGKRPDPGKAFEARLKKNGKDSELTVVNVEDQDGNPTELTVEGELNKLASNISIGRDWAGVHYFTDYIESLRMGEQVAIGILEEQKLTYGEHFSMTVPLFDGGSIRI